MNISVLFKAQRAKQHISMTPAHSGRRWNHGYHKYASIPPAEPSGGICRYNYRRRYSLGIKRYTHLNLKEAENIFIKDFPRKADYAAVSAGSDMEDLIQKAMNQNFVPVVDDGGKFIGIITRRSIIEYCYEKLKKMDKNS